MLATIALKNKGWLAAFGGNGVSLVPSGRWQAGGVASAGAAAGRPRWDARGAVDAASCGSAQAEGLCQKLETKYVLFRSLPLK